MYIKSAFITHFEHPNKLRILERQQQVSEGRFLIVKSHKTIGNDSSGHPL